MDTTQVQESQQVAELKRALSDMRTQALLAQGGAHDLKDAHNMAQWRAAHLAATIALNGGTEPKTLHIEAAATLASVETFTPEAIKSIPEHERRAMGLGCAISAWSKWDGAVLLQVFTAALEDANYHDLAAKVREF